MNKTRKQAEFDQITLVVNPGCPGQKALQKVQADRPDQQAQAVRKAREKYPRDPLVWVDRVGTLLPVIP